MNTSNPFQIPCRLPFAQLQQQRRERFRKKVMLGVVATAALLVILLIEGCVSEHKTASAIPANGAVAVQPQAAPLPAAVPAAKPVLTRPLPPIAPHPNTPVAALKTAPPAVNPVLVYVVKSGDTLARIAQQHHTTLKTLKSINGLNRDNVAVGDKLKLPAA
jgi:LysM repeat protein